MSDAIIEMPYGTEKTIYSEWIDEWLRLYDDVHADVYINEESEEK